MSSTKPHVSSSVYWKTHTHELGRFWLMCGINRLGTLDEDTLPLNSLIIQWLVCAWRKFTLSHKLLVWIHGHSHRDQPGLCWAFYAPAWKHKGTNQRPWGKICILKKAKEYKMKWHWYVLRPVSIQEVVGDKYQIDQFAKTTNYKMIPCLLMVTTVLWVRLCTLRENVWCPDYQNNAFFPVFCRLCCVE